MNANVIFLSSWLSDGTKSRDLYNCWKMDLDYKKGNCYFEVTWNSVWSGCEVIMTTPGSCL